MEKITNLLPCAWIVISLGVLVYMWFTSIKAEKLYKNNLHELIKVKEDLIKEKQKLLDLINEIETLKGGMGFCEVIEFKEKCVEILSSTYSEKAIKETI